MGGASRGMLHPKIKPHHLERTAVVYLRQSSMKQVKENQESLRLQYAMESRARELGWKNVHVIDEDLGKSAGPLSRGRSGFEKMLGMVAAGRVGIIFSREASRLSRNDQDWCRLLEVCQLGGTLMGDSEQVYDLDQMDDQLIFGIKGTMSSAELRTLRLRLHQGREAQAKRGEYRMRLPSGYIYADERPVKDPDVRAREAIATVFKKFREYRVGRKVHQWLVDEKYELPAHQYSGGKLRTQWKVPTLLFVLGILKNPFYAGAYTYGRRSLEKAIVDGTVVKRIGAQVEARDAKVFIPDHHEGYIDWVTYEENQSILRDNRARQSGSEAKTCPRRGNGLLVGIVRCGICGRKANVHYWNTTGHPRYQCHGEFDSGGEYCQSFNGAEMEASIVETILKVISPLGVEAAIEAEEKVRSEGSESLLALQRRAEQLDYEATRAFEQYDAVDPRNRLVASELERRWNSKLQASSQARAELEEAQRARGEPSSEDLSKMRSLGEKFETVWKNPGCSVESRKRIVRILIEEVVVTRTEAALTWIIHWRGGVHTTGRTARPKYSKRKTADEALEIIRSLAPKYEDGLIAAVLNKNGLVTGSGKRWNRSRVSFVRSKNAIAPPEQGSMSGFLNLKRASAEYGVSNHTISRLIQAGLVRNEQKVPLAPFELRREDFDSKRVRSILEKVRQGGPFELGGDVAEGQTSLFQ